MSELCLLDTHVLLWAVAEPSRLGSGIRSLVESNGYAMSVASFWELVNKKEKREAPVRDPAAWWHRYVTRPKTPVIPIRTSHVAYLNRMPGHHRDPYDRILIAQSAVEKMTLVTADEQILKYGMRARLAGEV